MALGRQRGKLGSEWIAVFADCPAEPLTTSGTERCHSGRHAAPVSVPTGFYCVPHKDRKRVLLAVLSFVRALGFPFYSLLPPSTSLLRSVMSNWCVSSCCTVQLLSQCQTGVCAIVVPSNFSPNVKLVCVQLLYRPTCLLYTSPSPRDGV